MAPVSKPWPSTADVWVHCPASIALTSRYPDERDSPARHEGTAAHEVLSRLLTGDMPSIGDDTRIGVPVDANMIAGAEAVLAALADVAGDYHSEHSIPATELGDGVRARLDVVALDHESNTLTVIDYKYGHRYVPVVDNWQLALSASAYAHEYQVPSGYTARLIIVQPRCYSASEPVREWRTDIATLHHLMSVAARSAEKSRLPDAPFRTGPHCYSCSGRRACSAFMATVEAAIDDAYGLTPRELSPTEIAGELVMLRDAAERLRARLTAVEAHAMHLLQSGHSVPGWTVAYSRPHLVWAVPQTDVLEMGAMVGVDLTAAKQVVTPAQAKKLGLDAGIVDACSSRPPGVPKLDRLTQTSIKSALSKG